MRCCVRPNPFAKGPMITPESINIWKNTLVSGQSNEIVVGRLANLENHFEMIRAEFVDLPVLCFVLAKKIVLIRREIALKQNVADFFCLLNEDPNFHCNHLSVRWLIAICDTIADHGNRQQQTSAVCISTFVNLIKLAETERLLAGAKEIETNSADQYQSKWPHNLGNGMSSYHLVHGDMPRNLFRRIDRVLETTPTLRLIFQTIVAQFKESSNLLTRLAKHNDRFWE